ncbi:hypothetical protein P886_3205 [Alteromonadaceae bacterium 2753L.S.0a.02]|nr:hypothetical protein P886_3205 [Alteromonadaceae bacterium 2753L.S.0a.02]
MNIWSLEKDLAIKHLLLLLEHDFAADSYLIEHHTKTDPKAIFICHRETPAMRAYIYTIAQREDRYGVQLEFPPQNAPVNLMETYENLRYGALKEILAVHLDLTGHPA